MIIDVSNLRRNVEVKDTMNEAFKEQHKRKKYHALERIGLLVDSDSFREIGSRRKSTVSTQSDATKAEYDGVITGRATIEGKTVYLFAQDFTIQGGSIGKAHGEKIRHIIELAKQNRSPIVGIYDSGGARIDEGIHSLAGCGDILQANVAASGIIPQISVIVGPCAGAAAYSPALTDFVFIVKKVGYMFVTGAGVVQSVTGETCDNQSLGGAEVHSERSGVAHFFEKNEKRCFGDVRKFISMLPSSFEEFPLRRDYDYVEKDQGNIADVFPSDGKTPYDVREIIREIADVKSFFEVSAGFAPSVVVGFIKIASLTVGVVANQPLVHSGVLDTSSSDKAARFIRFCDCFHIPLLTLVDTPGYLPGIEQEHSGIIRHGAKLIYAYSEANIPKVTVILRKAYGGAYIAMGSKHLHTDYNYALNIAEIAVMGAEGAVGLLYKKEIKEMPKKARASFIKRKLETYQENFMNPDIALEAGYVDEILRPEDIRRRVFEDFMALSRKSKGRCGEGHGNIPL